MNNLDLIFILVKHVICIPPCTVVKLSSSSGAHSVWLGRFVCLSWDVVYSVTSTFLRGLDILRVVW